MQLLQGERFKISAHKVFKNKKSPKYYNTSVITDLCVFANRTIVLARSSNVCG